MDKRHWPALIWLQIFCEGACRSCSTCSRVEVFFQHVIVLALHIFYDFFCFLIAGVCLRPRLEVHTVKPDLGDLISTLLKSKAGSTAKRYRKEILKFIDYCNFFRGVRSASFSPFVLSCLSF